ncbi:energy-coupling factor transporter transmembrane protein EcfT [Roseibium denhamense]|uniref:Biotin transport system permease protein n=1 Tax=Roseibium denhamense TaxID=76305 RepID=A0ABY1PCQ1_9HYPH|nr:energy-coupling factor transporter transmembrane protein EcfT [Roseibium denhamense]MTI04558.1 energy-coupling factor transporter transmembrane protein EcfT [Roseibium denhamense]SMP31284.1 biotin transport system permease protein [Roseibium denhamense]
MTSIYLPGNSWAHVLPASVKLLFVALMSLILFQAESLLLFIAALLLAVACYASLGNPGLKRLLGLKGLLYIGAIILAFHAWTGTMFEGVTMILRLAAMILLANFVSITTRMDDMLEAIQPMFRPLSWFGLSGRKPALGIALVLRFAPHMLEVYAALQEAYRARTGHRNSWRLIAPFALQSLRMSDNVAEALSARGSAGGMADHLQKPRKNTGNGQ